MVFHKQPGQYLARARWRAVHLRHLYGGLCRSVAASDNPLNTAGYAALRFWVHGGTGANKSLVFYTQSEDNAGSSPQFAFTAVANAWTEITVPLIDRQPCDYQANRLS